MVKLTGENSLGITDLYDARKFYKEDFYPVEALSEMPIDFLYENPNYGLINEQDETVYVLTDEERVNLKKFDTARVYGLNFVVDAFHSFREEFLHDVRENRIPSLPIIGELLPAESHIDFEELYFNYLRSMEDFLINEYIVDHHIINFEDLLGAIREFVLTMAKDHPITRSGFIDSRNCPLTASGLIVDVGKQDCSSDPFKGDLIQSRGFACFVQYAARHGFLVDKNAPWRLVCDTHSEKMRKYMLPYASSALSNEQILNTRYRVKSHYDDIYDLQDYIFRMYKSLIRVSPYYIRREGKKRSFISRENMVWYNQKKFDKMFWLKLLFDTRIAEIGHPSSYPEYDLELKEIQDTFRILGMRSALGKLGATVSKRKKRNTSINSYEPTKVKDYIR